jgi:hypothetical protein
LRCNGREVCAGKHVVASTGYAVVEHIFTCSRHAVVEHVIARTRYAVVEHVVACTCDAVEDDFADPVTAELAAAI